MFDKKMAVALTKRLLIRIALAGFALVGLSIIAFVIARVLPGDPVRFALGPGAPEWVADRLREQMNLDKPIYIQYVLWLRDALSGNLGESLFTRQSVTSDILRLMPATLELILYSIVIQIGVAVVLGVISGRYANSWVDNLIRVFSYLGASIPHFVVSIILIFIFGYTYAILPYRGRLSSNIAMPPRITGMFTIDALFTGNLVTFADAFLHIILPALAAAFVNTAVLARIIRAGVVENKDQDYIMMATSHGIPERVIMLKYLLKPSIIPAVAVMGLSAASMLSYLFVIESIFSWPGFAWYGMNAMVTKDLNAMVGVIVVTGLVYAAINIFVDLFTEYLDPRIRAAVVSR